MLFVSFCSHQVTKANAVSNVIKDKYPVGNSPQLITLQDNCLPMTISPLGQLPQGQLPLLLGQLLPRPITPISSTTPPSWTGNRGEYFRVVGILEIVEK